MRQRIINEEAERRLLAAYFHGLRDIVGQQVQFHMPGTMEQAVRLAVNIENVEKHRQLTEGPKRIFVARKEAQCSRCGRPGHYVKDCRQDPKVGRRATRDQGGMFPCR
jgi:ribosomal protein S14